MTCLSDFVYIVINYMSDKNVVKFKPFKRIYKVIKWLAGIRFMKSVIIEIEHVGRSGKSL